MTITIRGPSWAEGLRQMLEPVRGVVRGSSRLTTLLREYPLYSPPHSPGAAPPNGKYANDNFEYFMDTKGQRISALSTLLGNFDIHQDFENPTEDELGRFFNRIDSWSAIEWGDIRGAKAVLKDLDQKILPSGLSSMLIDTAIALGECAMAANGKFSWKKARFRSPEKGTWTFSILSNNKKGFQGLDYESGIFYNFHEYVDKRFFRAAISNRGVSAYAREIIAGRWDS